MRKKGKPKEEGQGIMRGEKAVSILVCLLCVMALITGCSVKKDSKPLVLKKFGPEDIRAGQIFNTQPNGESAIWAETEHATPTTVFVLNGVLLESAPQSEGRAVSAIVPRKLYEKPGEYPLYLLDQKTGRKSNEMKFVVKP
jgi:hypothetical protein